MPNFKTKSYELNELTPLTQSTQNALKANLIEECSICPLCGNELQKPVLDHQHLTNAETIGVNGAGLVRGVVCNQCNAFLGKLENNSKRFGIVDLPSFLINAAKYLQQDNLPYIHSSETRRLRVKFGKAEYNKLIKAYCLKTGKSKDYAIKKYPYNKYLTKTLKKLQESINIETAKPS